MGEYLRATGRAEVAGLAHAARHLLRADPEVLVAPERYYDEVVEIDLSALEPHVNGPHTPDLARPVSALAEAVRSGGYPPVLKATLIGSCTNSSYEDLSRAAHLARQAVAAGLEPKVPLFISPGSARVYRTMARDGLLETFLKAGATVLANACGPCIGQWHRAGAVAGRPESILSTFNRNFPGRNDGVAETCSFLAGPELVMAYTFAGDLRVDPTRDVLAGGFRFEPPRATSCPRRGSRRVRKAWWSPPRTARTCTWKSRPTASASASWILRTLGRPGLRAPAPARQDGGQDDDGPHLPGGPLAALSRPPRPHQRQPAARRHQCLHRGAGPGHGHADGETGLTFAAIARRYETRGLGSVIVGTRTTARAAAASTPP